MTGWLGRISIPEYDSNHFDLFSSLVYNARMFFLSFFNIPVSTWMCFLPTPLARVYRSFLFMYLFPPSPFVSPILLLGRNRFYQNVVYDVDEPLFFFFSLLFFSFRILFV